MPDQFTVDVELTRTQGRFVVSARDRFLVTDAPANRGGAEQAWMANELLLAAIGSCAVSSVAAFAREEDAPLRDVTATAHATRNPDDPTRYALVSLDVVTEGVEQEVADHLVERFMGNCPVWGTVSRGAEVAYTVTARQAETSVA